MQSLPIIVNRIKTLCEKRGVSINRMLVDSDAGANTCATMLAGSYPSIDKLDKMATYFGCSVDYLLGRSHDNSSADENLDSDVEEKVSLQVLSLRLKGLSFDEIGKRIGSSRQNANEIYHRAIARQRKSGETEWLQYYQGAPDDTRDILLDIIRHKDIIDIATTLATKDLSESEISEIVDHIDFILS